MRAAEPVVIAVDVGGTSFKGALVADDGRTRVEETLPLAGSRGEDAMLALESLCGRLVEAATHRGLAPLAIGIIAPGMDDASGRVMYASNLGWRDMPVAERLRQRLALPVATGHDVRTAGLAEGLLGAGRGARDLAFIMIGTGIAAALVSNGTAIAGARNTGGEFGHAPVVMNGERCACGQHGCLEAYASASSIARRYAGFGGSPALTAAEIAVAQARDPLAARVWADAVEALSSGLAFVTMLLDPEVFILGGGLVEAGPVLLDPLAAALDRRLAWRPAPPIRRSALGLSAGRIGAAILAYRLAGRAEIVEGWSALKTWRPNRWATPPSFTCPREPVLAMPPPSSRPHRSVLTGIALAACGYAMFAVQDATVKWLVQSYAVPEILFVRSGVIVIVALAVGGGPRVVAEVVRSRNQAAILVRAGLILGAWLLYYSAAARMGLAEITTLYFAAPVIAVCLSALFLKERVGAARWAAVFTGFVGVVVSAGPHGGVAAGPTAMALGAAACWGTSVVLVRWIGRSDSTLTQMLASNALFCIACLPVLPWMWHGPDGFGLALMIGLGLTGGLGQYLLYEGFRYAPASALAPIEYTGLVWAFLYGYAIWADIPRWNTFAGAGLIVAGSLGLIWFEDRRARRTSAASAATS